MDGQCETTRQNRNPSESRTIREKDNSSQGNRPQNIDHAKCRKTFAGNVSERQDHRQEDNGNTCGSTGRHRHTGLKGTKDARQPARAPTALGLLSKALEWTQTQMVAELNEVDVCALYTPSHQYFERFVFPKRHSFTPRLLEST